MFSVTARTVLELGSELISSDIIAFYELIKNGFDAKSKDGVSIRFNVVLSHRKHRDLEREIKEKRATFSVLQSRCTAALNSDAETLWEQAQQLISECRDEGALVDAMQEISDLNEIVVRDTGTGMALSDLTKKFLVIGTPSRKLAVESSVRAREAKSPYLGEKGLGRLSAMRLGNTLHVKTARKEDEAFNHLSIDWSEFENPNKMISDIQVEPYIGSKKRESDFCGTKLSIGKLSSDWNKERLSQLALEEFSLLTDPMADSKNRPRIALFWNGERVPIPALDKKLLEVAHASIWGKYTINEGAGKLSLTVKIRDLGFEHPEVEENVNFSPKDIYTLALGNKEAIPFEALISTGSFEFQAHWFNRQRLKASGGMDRDQLLKLQRQWVGVRMYRDGFRVYPYGDERDDWLGLDRIAMMAKGYTLNKMQLVGQVNIGRIQNPELIDQTNREGLRETHEQQVLLGVVQFSIQDQLRLAIKRVETKYKEKRVKPVQAKTEIARLEVRARNAIKSLRSKTNHQEHAVIEELQQTLLELTELAKVLRERNSEVEDDAKQMQDMAGIGLLVEIVAHELARTSEHALETIRSLQKTSPSEIGLQMQSLEASMKSIQKRLKVLDPLSASGRQAPERFSVSDLLAETLGGHAEQFQRHGIKIHYLPPKNSITMKTVKGYFVQVIENLIANSVYWLKLECEKSPLFRPVISVQLLPNPVRVVFSDNGPGVDPEHQERIFEMFFSLKESRKRRGLGLYISRLHATNTGGSLELDNGVFNESGRLNTFVYCVSEDS
jgi:signal transduction histidine kinase